MKHTVKVMAGLLVLASSLSGCLRDDRACQSDATCAASEACVEGLCRAGARVDAGADAGADATSPRDGGVDTGRDAGSDMGGVDSGRDAGDAETDPCPESQRTCDGECAQCPTDPNASVFTCEEGACLIDGCDAGWMPCIDGCCEGAHDIEVINAGGGLNTSISLTTDGAPHIIYRTDESSALAWRWWDDADGTWDEETIGEGFDLDTDIDEVFDLVATTKFEVEFIYTTIAPSGERAFKSIVGNYSATHDPPFEIAESTPFGFDAAMARDANGISHVVYLELLEDVGFKPRYVIRSNGWKQLLSEPLSGGSATGVDLTTDAGNMPHVAVSYVVGAGEKKLDHTWWDGSVWQVETVPFTSEVDPPVAIEIDAQGRVHVLGHDPVNQDVVYARKDDSGWVIEVVDATGELGKEADMALDPWGRPHVSYHEFSARNLHHAVRRDGVWRTSTADRAGDVGKWNSIAVDGYGRPHISYHDETNARVKYTYFDGFEWRPSD